MHCGVYETYLVSWFSRHLLNRKRGWDQSAMGICALCYIRNLCGVMVFQKSILNWRSGWGQSAIDRDALCYIYDTYLV